MDRTGTWAVYGDWAFLACAISAALFVLLYLVLSPWWRTATGRNIMAVMGLLAVAMVYFAWIIQVGGVPDWFWQTRAILFTLLFLALTWRVVLFVRSHVMARLRMKEKRDADRRLG